MPVPMKSCTPIASAGRQSFSLQTRARRSKARSVVEPRPIVPFSLSVSRNVASSQGSACQLMKLNRRWWR